MEFTREQLTEIIESAEVVITALAGTNEDLQLSNSKGMVEAWDHLNDVAAPPKVVSELARIALERMDSKPGLWEIVNPGEGTFYSPHEPRDFEEVAQVWYAVPAAVLIHGGDEQQRISVKPHVYRELVNQLRDTSVKYAGCQQLREQLDRTLQLALMPEPRKNATEELSKTEREELTSYRWLVERLEAILRPDCPGFEAACRALWDREPHRMLEKAGYPIDYDSQPPAIKAGLKRQVLTVLRTAAKEVRGEG